MTRAPRRGRREGRAAAAAPFALAVAVALALAVPAGAGAQDRPRNLTASSAIVVESTTGDVALAKDPHTQRPIASTTKIMTALVTVDRAALSDVFTTVRYRALPIESVAGFGAGERVTVADLLRALLTVSANDAAATLAERVGGSRARFVRLMNRKARALGLEHTRFANPVGLDQRGNHSTAAELVVLARELRAHPFLRKVVDAPKVQLDSGARTRVLQNRNLLLRRAPWVNGVKTGRTLGAGYVLVGSATRRGVTVLSAVLGTSSEQARDAESLALLRFGLSRYRVARPVRRNRVLASVPIRFRRGAELDLVARSSVRRVVRKGRPLTTRLRGVPAEVEGPIRAGQRFGAVEVRQGGELLATVPLVAASAIPAADVAQRARTWFTRPVALAVVLVALAGTVQVALLRRRRAARSRRPGRGELESPA